MLCVQRFSVRVHILLTTRRCTTRGPVSPHFKLCARPRRADGRSVFAAMAWSLKRAAAGVTGLRRAAPGRRPKERRHLQQRGFTNRLEFNLISCEPCTFPLWLPALEQAGRPATALVCAKATRYCLEDPPFYGRLDTGVCRRTPPLDQGRLVREQVPPLPGSLSSFR